MTLTNIRKFIGLGGVAKTENVTAQRWGRRFELIMVAIAIWLPIQWHMALHHFINPSIEEFSNWVIWFVFISETTTLVNLVDTKWLYIKRNWMNLVIIVLGIPFIWESTPLLGILRGLQLLLMARLLFPWWNTTVRFLSRNRLGATLTTAFVTTTLAGALMAIVDNGVKTPWDGIWWAWQTVTTVGYGDVIPTSVTGKILAIFMMIMGIALISLLTANFSAYFVSKGASKVAKTEDQILKTLQEMQKKLDKLEEKLK